MSFESGCMGFRMMMLLRAMPDDCVALFSKGAAGPLEDVEGSPVRGWVTGRHMLDTNITPETGFSGGYLRLALREAVRKVPGALFKAEVKREEMAQLAALGRGFLKGPEKAEIKRGVEERLLPDMAPTLRAFPFVYAPGDGHLYAGVTSDRGFDVLNSALMDTLGFGGVDVTPSLLADQFCQVDVRDWLGTSFSPDVVDESMFPAPGREFLTWLWFRAETGDGQVPISDGRKLGVLVEGPLTFANEGNGAHVGVLRAGMPEISMEAKACLLAGKKLKSARLSFALDADTIWKFVLDADDFTIRSMQVPKTRELMSAEERFRERMEFLEQWRGLFFQLYSDFVYLRAAPNIWKAIVYDMQEWVRERPERK